MEILKNAFEAGQIHHQKSKWNLHPNIQLFDRLFTTSARANTFRIWTQKLG